MNLINVNAVERVETPGTNGSVFIGTRHWVQTVEGAWIPQADLTEARLIAGVAYINDDRNLWQIVLDWALAKGYNSYNANLLAGHCWCEIL